jgi:hypothetical protein
MPDNDDPGMAGMQSLILTELRSLRGDYNMFTLNISNRLSSIETSVSAVIGGSQPGRLTILEEKVSGLQQAKWYVLGAAATAGCFVGMLGYLIK